MDVAPRRPWGKRIFLGCVGCFGVLVLLFGVVVALNWTRIETSIEESKGALAGLQEVRAALVEELGVPVQVHSNRDMGSGSWSLRLEVQGLALEDHEQEAKAREIAVLAAHSHPEPERYNVVMVKFVKGVGRVVKVQTWRNHMFEMEDLLTDDR